MFVKPVKMSLQWWSYILKSKNMDFLLKLHLISDLNLKMELNEGDSKTVCAHKTHVGVPFKHIIVIAYSEQ